MKIQTTQFGEIELAEDRVLTFERGIPGFEEYKEYVLIPADSAETTPFFFLQSVEEEEVSFFLVDPFTFFGEYDVKLGDQQVERLALEEPSDAIVLTIITSKGELKEATTNLKAPIIINNKERLGMQVVLDNKTYPIKQPLFQSDSADARQV